MRQFLPNMHPLSFTTSAVIVAYLLIDDLSIVEQAALGSWFNVIGDILVASSSWGSVLEERNEVMKSSQQNDKDNDIELLKKTIAKIQKILDDRDIKNEEVKKYE